MSDKKRPDYPNAFHHVMARGVAKQNIFSDAADYQYFLKKFGSCLQQKNVKCFAWTLMPNHFHFLLQRTTEPIYKFMHSFLTSYAMYYNRRYDRPGHLFQNRFKSILCQEDAYFLTLIKYIHQNPLRAQLVKDLNELQSFPWCGHAALMGEKAYAWHDTDYTWKLLDENIVKAMDSYAELIRSDLSEQEISNARFGKIMKTKENGWKWTASLTEKEKKRADVGILGDQYFIRHALSKRNITIPDNNGDFVFDELVKRAADIFLLSLDAILTGRRQPAILQARSLVCAWSVDVFQRTAAELALYLDINIKTVYRLINKGRELIYSNPKLVYENIAR